VSQLGVVNEDRFPKRLSGITYIHVSLRLRCVILP